MAKSRDPFLTALSRMREAAQTGAYAPGRPIVIIDEARRLGISTTPVREALAWLCGEGVVERGPTGGFLARRLDAGAVRDRYGFRLACLWVSMDLSDGLPHYGSAPLCGASATSSLEVLFERLVRRSGNGLLLAAYAWVSGQLRILKDLETRLFDDHEAEARALLTLAGREATAALREALETYHDRRVQAAPILALEAAAQRGPGGPPWTPHTTRPSSPAA